MTSENLTMHNKVLAYLIEIVHEEGGSSECRNHGSRHVDANGDTQVDVLLSMKSRTRSVSMKRWPGLSMPWS